MNIKIADKSGFCFGVKRAIDIANEKLRITDEIIFSYGPLIHNPQEVNRLENNGLLTIEDFKSLEENSKIIIRSHGISKRIEEEMIKGNLDVIDTTCPYVKAVHKKVEKFMNKGYNIIIIGDPNHPEVIGINGWCEDKAFIVNTLDDLDKLPYLDKAIVVSQTTNTKEKFESLSQGLKSKVESIEIFNTICSATRDRQYYTEILAKEVDAMIVIGGRSSSNTKKLSEISAKYCRNVFHIERIEDLSLQSISKFNTIGITAGASTPDWIIKEAVEAMDNFNDNEMMEAIESSFKKIHRGETITGEVLFVTNSEVMVNINYKSDGIISKDELSYDPNVNPKDLFKPGDKIQVYVVKIDDGDGNVVLSSKRVQDVKIWDELEEDFNNKNLLEVKVDKVVKGGLIAIVKGIQGFIPASHVSANFVKDLEEFKGNTFEVEIIDFDKEKRRVVLSRREVEKREIDKSRNLVWDNLEVDKIIEGTVQRLTDFGAFIDIGGVDGLIHISDLSWNRVKHPSEIVKAGQKVEVQVLSFDKAKNRISLGLKQTIEEPWEVFKNEVQIGDIVEGKIVNLLDFGAFVRLPQDVDGLLHVSQISKDHIAKPSDALKLGESVNVKVIDVDFDERRISLSIKATEEDSEEEVKEENSHIEEDETTIGDIINKE